MLVPQAQAAGTITVSQTGHHASWQGRVYHWVDFPGSAHITGTVSGVATGTPVALQATAFPFTHSYATVADTHASSSGALSFAVYPSVATRYRVVAAGAVSRVLTYYVLSGFKLLSQTLCQPGATTCHASVSYANRLPSSVGAREVEQRLYLYVGVRHGSQTPPATLDRKSSFTHSTERVASTKWVTDLSFSFTAGTGPWYVTWASCTKTLEGSDGFGVPVHTGCGTATSLPNKTSRLSILS